MGALSFKVAVVQLIPQLRAYAIALTHSACEADDLVQDTLMRAWSYRQTFQPGAQLKPWLFKILRTRFYSDTVKRRMLVQDVDGLFAAELTCPAEQDWRIEYDELLVALSALSHDTREAVLLVLGAGLTYEEAAQVCGCPEGTIKSRVNRGRDHLARLLDPPAAPAHRNTLVNHHATVALEHSSFSPRLPPATLSALETR